MRAAWTPHTDSSRSPASFLESQSHARLLANRSDQRDNIPTVQIFECHYLPHMSPKKHRRFARFVTAHRKALGLSMNKLAAIVGVTPSNISWWESGEGLPGTSALEPLARGLKVSYEDLLEAAGYAHPEGLPDPISYTRKKFPDYPDEAMAEAERFFARFENRYGTDGNAPKPERKKGRRK
ncbi:MAG: helix-turn-helix transcriptional regulator [Solirubrobacterales bacterium]